MSAELNPEDKAYWEALMSPRPLAVATPCVFCDMEVKETQWFPTLLPAAHAMCWQRAELERAKASKEQPRGASPARPEAASETVGALRAGGAV